MFTKKINATKIIFTLNKYVTPHHRLFSSIFSRQRIKICNHLISSSVNLSNQHNTRCNTEALSHKHKCYLKIEKFTGINKIANDALPTTYLIGYYNPSVSIIDLVSHTAYVVWVNFIHKWQDLHSLTSTPNDRFFEKLFHGSFIYSHSFCQKSAGRKSPKKYFFLNFIFDD